MCLDENEWKLGFNSYDDIMDKIKALSKEKNSFVYNKG